MQGCEQSRRDDLEQIAYTIIYLLQGKLPWQSLPGKTKDEKNRMIRKKKQDTGIDLLCKGAPGQFSEFLKYAKSLGFTEEPDYKYCIEMFEHCMMQNKINPGRIDFCWNQEWFQKSKKEF